MFRLHTKAMVWFCLGFLAVAVSPATPFHVGNPNTRERHAGRFVVLDSDSSDVLDVRTSLRWQKEPGSAKVTGAGASCNGGNTCVWQEAVDYCAAMKNGWRLPGVKELISLVDYSVASPGPALPPGHPFQKVQLTDYWTATTIAGSLTGAWNVSFGAGIVEGRAKNVGNLAWCVR